MSIETILAGDGRRAPVNGAPRGTIAWSEHLKAWESYHREWPGQDAEKIAQRGGFGIDELVAQLGHLPLTWKPSAGTRFVPGIEPTDHLADLIRDALTGDEAVEAIAQTIARGRRGADAKVNDTDRFAANVAIAALVETIGGK